MGALKDWANENWVDIGAPKKDGKYQPCGRKNAKTSKRLPLEEREQKLKGSMVNQLW